MGYRLSGTPPLRFPVGGVQPCCRPTSCEYYICRNEQTALEQDPSSSIQVILKLVYKNKLQMSAESKTLGAFTLFCLQILNLSIRSRKVPNI
jgi:hypothetical protein